MDDEEASWRRWIKREELAEKRKNQQTNRANVAAKPGKKARDRSSDDEGEEIYPSSCDDSVMPMEEEKEDEVARMLREVAADFDAAREADRRRVPPLIRLEDIEHLLDECDHVYVFREDIGTVCEECGLVKKLVSDTFDAPLLTMKSTPKPAKTKFKFRDDYSVILHEQLSDMKVDLKAHPDHMRHMNEHQKDAFRFLSYNLLGDSPGGVILHHAPGTGKSFIVISFLTSYFAKFTSSRAIIVAPKIMLHRWQEEFRKWEVTSIPTYVLDGGNPDMVAKWSTETSVLLMTPQLLAAKVANTTDDAEEIWLQERLTQAANIMVVDEAHYARNEKTKISDALQLMVTPRRIFLSGTVFQNNLDELFNLFTLCRPNFMSEFPDYVEFAAESRTESRTPKADAEKLFFKERIENTLEDDLGYAIRQFQRLTAPFLHWYSGKVLEKLPGLEEVLVVLNLSEPHKQLLWTASSNKSFIAQDSQLARACVHPCLAMDLVSPSLENQDPADGVKTAFVMELIRYFNNRREKEKVIIFGQYKQPLNLLKQMFRERLKWTENVHFFLMSGKTPPEERARITNAFNASSSARVILASIKACGEGISLVGGSRVVILDTAWNPSTVRQAVSRAFRLGQSKKVYVYRLLAGNTPTNQQHEASKLSSSTRKDFLANALFNTDLNSDELVSRSEMELHYDPVDLDETQDEFLQVYCDNDNNSCQGVYYIPSLDRRTKNFPVTNQS